MAGVAVAQRPAPKELEPAKDALAARDFVGAKGLYTAYLVKHPGSVDGELGIADAELGMRRYEAAELAYRQVVALQPQLWAAHKNLVIVEAALGRWEEFDRERAVLRGARERGADGISKRESDLIDTFDVAGQRWLVREYYEPVGRSMARYNFTRFSKDGKVQEYVSLENAEAAKEALAAPEGTVAVKKFGEGKAALNWYTGSAHGTVREYATEPTYERLRRDVRAWLARSAGANH